MELAKKDKIVQAVVYKNCAMVTREISLKLKGDEDTFIFKNLPINIDENHIRAKAFGSGMIQIESVDVKEEFLEEINDKKILALETELKNIDDNLKQIENKLLRWSNQNNFLKSLKEKIISDFSKEFHFNKISVDELKINYEGIKEKNIRLIKDYLDTINTKQELEEAKTLIENKLYDLQTERNSSFLNCNLSFKAIKPGDIRIQISYLVQNANWNTFYDARLLMDSREIELSYHANINQHSGEDWQDIELILSTSNPNLPASIPEPDSWFINFNSTNEPHSEFGFNENKSGVVVNFAAPKKETIFSDGNNKKTTLAVKRYPVEIEYVSIPKESQNVFIKTKTINTEMFPFLSGEVFVYHEYDYIGKSKIKTIVPNEKISLYMGTDDNIKVERTLLNRVENSKSFSNNKKINYEYITTIENYKEQKIEIEILEALPISRNSEIKIKLENAEPEQSDIDEKNYLSWKFSLDNNEKQKIKFDFSVEYPENKSLVGI